MTSWDVVRTQCAQPLASAIVILFKRAPAVKPGQHKSSQDKITALWLGKNPPKRRCSSVAVTAAVMMHRKPLSCIVRSKLYGGGTCNTLSDGLGSLL